MKQLATLLVLCVAMSMASLNNFAAEEEVGGIWIDVRSRQEYRQGHIEGAVNIPAGDIGHRVLEFVDDLSIPVHLYDGTGVFAGLALELLMEMGFDYVINEGSYEAILKRQGE